MCATTLPASPTAGESMPSACGPGEEERGESGKEWGTLRAHEALPALLPLGMSSAPASAQPSPLTMVFAPGNRWGEGSCIVIDTNVALHQMDFLDVAATDGVLRNMIVLQTVLEEVKHRNLSVFKRLKTMVQTGGRKVFVFANEHHADTYSSALLGESPNDRNDRCIRVAAAWFERQLQGEHNVELITNDRECRSRAIEQGLKCETVYEWAKANLPAKYLETIAQASEGGGGGFRGRTGFQGGVFLPCPLVGGANPGRGSRGAASSRHAAHGTR